MHKSQAHSQPRLKGLVFDLDGTLIDSLSTTLEGFNYAICEAGGAPLSPAEILAHFGPGESDIFTEILGPDQAAKAYSFYRNFMTENLNRVPLHAGVPELLEAVKSAGVPVSIVTGRGWESTEFILKHHSLLDRFVTVIAHDHVSSPKPSPEGILLAVSRMKLEPADVLYIGDSTVDVQASRRAGSGAVAALWDLLAHREVLAEHDPHHWAEHPSAVWELWERHRI